MKYQKSKNKNKKMDILKIPINAFVIKYKNVLKYTPEIFIKIEPFDKVLWELKFPYYSNVNIKKLQLTNIGIYSIASPTNSRNLINFLNDLNNQYKFTKYLDNLVVTEANGGIGGFSIRLAKSFNKLNIIEINKLHTNIIANNLSEYNIDLTGVKIFNMDYLDMIYNLDQDILIFDLPWSGRGYKYIKNLHLGLNNINIWFIINELYKRNKFKICALMVPVNFDIQNFICNIISPNIVINKMNDHYFIFVINLF